MRKQKEKSKRIADKSQGLKDKGVLGTKERFASDPVGRMGQDPGPAAEKEASAQEKMRHMGGGTGEPARRKKSVLSSKEEITDEKAKDKLRQMGDTD
jgi:hypothetical protein